MAPTYTPTCSPAATRDETAALPALWLPGMPAPLASFDLLRTAAAMSAYLHELRRTNDPYRVTETGPAGYNLIAGVSGESDNLSRGASSMLTPSAARLRVSRGVRP